MHVLRGFVVLLLALGASPATAAGGVVVADLDTDINAVSADFLERTIRDASRDGASLVVIRIDTPGGRLDATRRLTQAILGSSVPVACWVTPSGAQAASAGFFVLMACDVAAMAPGTNGGAAAVVGGEGQDLPKTLGKKATEDASALLRSLVAPRGRPTDDAVKTVTEALSYSDTEAKEKKLVEILAKDLPDLLAQLDGRSVKRVGKPDATLATKGVPVSERKMPALQRALGVVASPPVAALLFLLGLGGLYIEMQHPGASLPGVLGGICLLLALFAMSVLPTNWVGIGLVLLGLLFFFLEVKMATGGLFAIGGAISLILGAVLLFHRNDLAPRGELWFVVAGAATTAAILALLSWRAIAAQSLPERVGAADLVGRVVPARTAIAGTGKVFLDGAVWEARSDEPVAQGDPVEVVRVAGLALVVRPKQKQPNAPKEKST